MRQKTIGKEVSVKGIGLHTGKKCKLILKPAKENAGILFKMKNSDITVPAFIDYVTGGIRGTTITKDGLSLYTIEHLLATLFVYGINNVIVEMSSSEPPIGDGSASIFVELVEKAGVVELDENKKIFKTEETIEYKNGDVNIMYSPYDKFLVECEIDYKHPVLGRQKKVLEITEENFKEEIAPSRTFCFDYEIEHLRRKGLAKGGSFDNAIVIGEKKIHNPPLRFEDEFVRHKILDLIGDISLIGMTIIGKIIAYKCGHTHNINFTKLLKTKTENITHEISRR